MRYYIKTFESYSKQDWESQLNWVHNKYKSRDGIEFLDANHSNGGYLLNWKTNDGQWYRYNIFTDTNGEMKLSITLYKSNYSSSTNELITLNKQQYDKVKKVILEISNYLDDSENLSDSTISDIFDTDERELKYMEMEYKITSYINNIIKEYIDNTLSFESSYKLWTSNTEGTYVNESIDVLIMGIEDIRPLLSTDPILLIKCKYRGMDMKLNIASNSVEQYIDLSSYSIVDYPNNLIQLEHNESNLTRRELRERDTNPKFPKFLWMELVPDEWETIEFIKSCKSILEQFKNMN